MGSSWIMISVAFSIAVALAVNIEQLGGNLYSIFLFENIINNSTSWVFDPSVILLGGLCNF